MDLLAKHCKGCLEVSLYAYKLVCLCVCVRILNCVIVRTYVRVPYFTVKKIPSSYSSSV